MKSSSPGEICCQKTTVRLGFASRCKKVAALLSSKYFAAWNVYVQYYSLFCVHVYVLVYELTHVNVHAIGPLPYRGKLS